MKKIILFKVLILIGFLFTNISYAQDSDGDGIVDSVDLDDDNDGIIDTYECSSAIQFGDPSLLTAQDLADVKIGEKVIFSNALLFQNQYYDLVVTITSKQGDFVINCSISSSTYNLEGIKVDSFDASQNEYFTYSFDLVHAGTATPANPMRDNHHVALSDTLFCASILHTTSPVFFTSWNISF